MNFLLRTTQPLVPELPSVPETAIQKDVQPSSKPTSTLEGLIAEDPYPNSSNDEEADKDNVGIASGVAIDSTSKIQFSIGNHSDVTEDEGWIIIPNSSLLYAMSTFLAEELPDCWSNVSCFRELQSLDRSFVFPGEQLHILVCLSASEQDFEIITPFRVAAVMSKNSSYARKHKWKKEILGKKSSSVSGDANGIHEEANMQVLEENGRILSVSEDSPRTAISATKSLLRMEDHKQQTQTLLARFRNSTFFVRITGSDEPLWSRQGKVESSASSSEKQEKRSWSNDGGSRKISRRNLQNSVVDRGSFDGITSSGMARSTARCYSLSNGDIVVLLQVNVGTIDIADPVLEVLQYEKCPDSNSASMNQDSSFASDFQDPCRELLSWLLPLDHSLPPPRPLSPPLGSTSSLVASHQRSSSSGSQLFSFSHFRSYSMPSLPQVTGPSFSTIPWNSRPAINLEDLDRFLPEKLVTGHDTGNEGLLSFRGVPLEPERFSVHCGLEGIYLPGCRWRRKLEIVQPIEIHTFTAECIAEDLLCVQVKNISPTHLPDLVIFLDSITIVFEEASKGGPPLYLPIASIESGNGHSLPNLALRRGEEHSFVLRPAAAGGREFKTHVESHSPPSQPKFGVAASSTHQMARFTEETRASSATDCFAIMVSCRCNYSESKLFFKQPTSWRPRVSRDLMISVSSEITEQTCKLIGRLHQLPVQVLTLQASNLTREDLTLTVNAPISSTCPSVVSLIAAPANPLGRFNGFPVITGRVGTDKRVATTQRLSSMPILTENQKQKDGGGGKRSFSLGQRTVVASDVTSGTELGSTHLWLQSKVPLGCVPAQSSAIVKLELLPLTDGIITLDTLQVVVKEKGLTYVPEQPLNIYATSSIGTGFD